MSDTDWLEPLDRRIEAVRQETEAIRLETELYFVVSEWWDEVFSTAVREGRVDDIKKLVKQILEVKNDCQI